MTPKIEALRLLEESLKELESSKGSILSGIQKLLRASTLLGNRDIQFWCEIQLGDHRFVNPLQKLLDAANKKENQDSEKFQADINKAINTLKELQLKQNIHYTHEELVLKNNKAGGGYANIGFIEERYADLVRTKSGNDRTYYKNNLYEHLNYAKKKAHQFASTLFNKLKFSGTVSDSFDIIKNAVDDKLLDLNSTLGEQLMLAFKGISSEKTEEWSQALTTCRRLLEGVADELYPPTTDSTKGRSLSQAQYVNRLWAFMDKSIESDSNKELAKTHIDFLGSWLEKVNKISNKGVHAEVTQLEAVKAVFHTYLVIADLLEYANSPTKNQAPVDINSASIDEIEALLDVNRSVAKAIIKARVQHGTLDRLSLSKIPGIGPKTLEKAVVAFSL